MHYYGMTFRPPYEANSVLLQVTVGCSHNSCRFCTMYRDVPFELAPKNEILGDIIEASRRWPYARRVFLLNGDAFVLSADKLIDRKAHV